MDNYSNEAEEKLIELVKEKEEADKRLLTLEWVISILSCIILFVPIFIGALLPMEDLHRVIVCLSGLIPGFVGLFFAMRIEQVAGFYKCAVCGHRHVPSFTQVFFAMHMGRTRKMKCPKCGQRSWQKKVISKEEDN